MSGTIQISFYGRESYESIYTTLARVFPPKSSSDGTTTWVAIPIDASASLTFFAPEETKSDDVDVEEQS